MPDMPRIEREIVVAAAPDAVFHALVTPAERVRWMTTMEETPLATALEPGARISARRRDALSRSRYDLRVTALEAPRRIETEVRRNGSAAGRGGYHVFPHEDGARVVGFAEFELGGLQRVMTPLVSANLEKGLEADLMSLKRHVEAR